jgi:SNARE associated Golgi protein
MAPAWCCDRGSHFRRWLVLLVRTPLPSGDSLRWPLNRYPQFIDRSEAFIKTYGGASVFQARFIAVVRAFVPLVAGILGMSSRQFYAVNILSALAWAPAHVFPGVLLGMAPNLAGLSPARLAILLIVGLIAVLAAGRALRSYLNRYPCPASLPDRAALRGFRGKLQMSRRRSPSAT